MSYEFLLKNFADSELELDITVAGTTITIDSDDASLFPEPSSGERFAAVLYDGVQNPEIVHCTANPLDGTFTVVRARESTTAVAWVAGTRFTLVPTAASIRGHIPGPATVRGDLDVQGTVVTIDSDNVGAAAAQIEIKFNRGSSGDDSRIIWDENAGLFMAVGLTTSDLIDWYCGHVVNARETDLPYAWNYARALPLPLRAYSEVADRAVTRETDDWADTIIGSGTIALVGTTSGGLLQLATSAAGGDSCQTQRTSRGVDLTTNVIFWAMVVWNPAGGAEGETVIGLAETDTTICAAGPPTVDDFVGFVTDNDGDIDFVTSLGGSETRTSAIATVPTADTTIELAFQVNASAGTITPSVDGIEKTAHTATLPTEVLRESFAIRATTAVIRRLKVHAFKLAKVL